MGNREDLGKLLLRIVLASVLLFHGVYKLTHGVEWIKGPLGSFGLPGALAYGVYAAEVIAPVFLIAGWKARLAALVIAFDMLMALVLVLRSRVFSINPMGGGWAVELEIMILSVAVALFLLGSGRYRLGRRIWD